MSYADKEQLRIVILTAEYRIEGEIHVLADARLTDSLNSKARDFLAVTDARVYLVDTGELVCESEYLAVNRDSMIVILPAST